jgi:hypothetical protein
MTGPLFGGAAVRVGLGEGGLADGLGVAEAVIAGLDGLKGAAAVLDCPHAAAKPTTHTAATIAAAQRRGDVVRVAGGRCEPTRRGCIR